MGKPQIEEYLAGVRQRLDNFNRFIVISQAKVSDPYTFYLPCPPRTGQCLSLDCCAPKGWRCSRQLYQQQVQRCACKYFNIIHTFVIIHLQNIHQTICQIGNRFALTAAHCLLDEGLEEILPHTYFSILLGFHDRRNTDERNRCVFVLTQSDFFFFQETCSDQ